jgi:hypothetical protein
MTSSRRAAAASVVALAAAGCGGSVHDLSAASDPLVVIHGHVDVAALERPNPSSALIAALIWAEVPALDPTCLAFSEPRIAAACPDPYGVFNGEVGTWSPVGADGRFDLALLQLPAVRVSVGDAVTRIAYGSVVVLEDVDGNGQPTLVAAAVGSDRFDAPAPQPSNPDTIVGASFYDLHANQTRVVFREGGWVPDSNFYPLPGCDAPVTGLSILTAPPYSDATPPAGGCVDTGTDATVEVTPLAAADGLAYLCRSAQIGVGLRSPGDRPPRGSTSGFICLSGTGAPPALPGSVLDVVYPGVCPWLRSYALSGCSTDPSCTMPEWDVTASPPSWWPCR